MPKNPWPQAAAPTIAALRFYDFETRGVMYEGNIMLFDRKPLTGDTVVVQGERLKIVRRRQQRGEVHCRAYVYRLDEIHRIGSAVGKALAVTRDPTTGRYTESFDEAARRVLDHGPAGARPVAMAVLARGARHERMRNAAAAALIISD
jgi:hypothetical protein